MFRLLSSFVQSTKTLQYSSPLVIYKAGKTAFNSIYCDNTGQFVKNFLALKFKVVIKRSMKTLPDWRIPLECVVKGPYPLESRVESKDDDTGSSKRCDKFVIDVLFQEPVTVGDITFKNYYTATMTIQCKRRNINTSAKGPIPWETYISQLKLMKYPEFEEGSQKRLTVTQNLIDPAPLQNVVALRFLLHQPSDRWKKFFIEDLKIYKDPPSGNELKISVPPEFSEGQVPPTFFSGDMQEEMDPKLVCAARHLQNLWALAEFARTFQTSERLGRFEVDGSYEIIQLQHS